MVFLFLLFTYSLLHFTYSLLLFSFFIFSINPNYLVIFKTIYLYLNSWEAQKSCDEVKANTIVHADFQIGLMSLLHIISNNSVKIEKRTKEYSVIVQSRKKSKMKKSINILIEVLAELVKKSRN